MFSGDHWAASIVKKMQEQRNKEDVRACFEQLQCCESECRVSLFSLLQAVHKKKGSLPGASFQDDGGDAAPTNDSDAPRGGGGHLSLTGKATAESKEDQLLNQITEEMRSMRNHFIVVTLLELKKGQSRAIIRDPVRFFVGQTLAVETHHRLAFVSRTCPDQVPLISNEFVDTRSAFLERCQMYHWQFDELRNAQHSTLMLLYHLHGMHKAAKAKLVALHATQADTHAPTMSTSACRSTLQVGQFYECICSLSASECDHTCTGRDVIPLLQDRDCHARLVHVARAC